MYEITFLVKEEKDVSVLKDLLKSLSGKIMDEKSWGLKKLSYPIYKKDSLYYFTWNIEIEENKLEEMKKKLSFDNTIVRYLLLKKEDKNEKKTIKLKEIKSS